MQVYPPVGSWASELNCGSDLGIQVSTLEKVAPLRQCFFVVGADLLFLVRRSNTES
jgi:hypothetical protein